MVTAEVVGNVYLKLELTGFAEGWVWDIEGDWKFGGLSNRRMKLLFPGMETVLTGADLKGK